MKKFTKPGPKVKKAKIWNKTVRTHDIERPKETHCRFCHIENDGTCCYRHSEDPDIKFLVGGGVTGGKILDQMTVWGCNKCDIEMSTKPFKRWDERQEIFDLRFERWKNKWKEGIIKTWLL